MYSVKYAVISAAGMGTRLGLNRPKPLVEVNGKTIIEHQLELLKDVENVRIIVGFMESELIEHAKQIRGDIVFVRNPDYKTTSNSHSLWLGTRDLDQSFIAIDGDMIIEPGSFKTFLQRCQSHEDLIGIAKAKSEEAVFVQLDDSERVTKFFRNPFSEFEWCGIACFSNIKFTPNSERYVYQFMEENMPLDSHVIDCYEIDTPADLDLAIKNTRHFML